MNFLEPKKNLGLWLVTVLKDLVERTKTGDKEAYETLLNGLTPLVLGLEKGYIEENFAEWIDTYEELLSEYRKNPDNFLETQHNTSQQEPEE